MNNLKQQFQGDLDEYDSISLAKELFKFGLSQGAEYPKCEMVSSFYIDDSFRQTRQWLPYLKLAFNWTKDIDNDCRYLVNSIHTPEEFLKMYKGLCNTETS
ncbi:MAG TPA: hypothetical protein H9825_01075 [Candidatus Sphingobacterium stercorigallinarum]|nr:hypothetical protein [Candidatus Sphingobacterium stercorigallinarum]